MNRKAEDIMDREIKFRAWDLRNKWMDDEIFIFAMDGNVYDMAQRKYDTPNTEIEGADDYFKLMQYTGLKDKNGREIYESDYLDEKYRWKVTWLDGAFYAVSDNSKLDLNNMLLIDLLKFRERAGIPCEVVGNEYEG